MAYLDPFGGTSIFQYLSMNIVISDSFIYYFTENDKLLHKEIFDVTAPISLLPHSKGLIYDSEIILNFLGPEKIKKFKNFKANFSGFFESFSKNLSIKISSKQNFTEISFFFRKKLEKIRKFEKNAKNPGNLLIFVQKNSILIFFVRKNENFSDFLIFSEKNENFEIFENSEKIFSENFSVKMNFLSKNLTPIFLKREHFFANLQPKTQFIRFFEKFEENLDFSAFQILHENHEKMYFLSNSQLFFLKKENFGENPEKIEKNYNFLEIFDDFLIVSTKFSVQKFSNFSDFLAENFEKSEKLPKISVKMQKSVNFEDFSEFSDFFSEINFRISFFSSEKFSKVFLEQIFPENSKFLIFIVFSEKLKDFLKNLVDFLSNFSDFSEIFDGKILAKKFEKDSSIFQIIPKNPEKNEPNDQIFSQSFLIKKNRGKVFNILTKKIENFYFPGFFDRNSIDSEDFTVFYKHF